MMPGRLAKLAMALLLLTSICYAEIAKESYKISAAEVNEKIQPGDIMKREITFTNLKSNDLEIYLDIMGDVAELIELSESIVVIPGNSERAIELIVYGKDEPRSFNGSLAVTEGINELIPISIMIESLEDSPVGTLMIELKLLQDLVPNGRKLNYKIDLYNLMADNEFNITLIHKINKLEEDNETSDGNNWSASETISMVNSHSLLREFEVPNSFDMGDYALTVEAHYSGYTAVVKGLFMVERPLYAKKVGGIMPVWAIVTVFSFCTVSYFMFLFIKKQKEKKKRFHATVDYKEMPQEGERSLFVGYFAETKKKCFLDMDRLTVHSIVAGSTGGGKSISAQDIVEECLIKGVAVCVFDPTAQWSGMLRKLTDKNFLSFYTKFGLNPKKDARAFPGNIKAIKDHREIVDIFKYMKPGEIQVFTTNTLDPKNYDTFVANMIRQIFHSKLEEFRGLKYIVAFDEIHRILPKFGGSGEGFTQIERGCREFRKWGIGILLISQVLSDFVGEIKANINTLVQMKTRDEGDLNRIKMQYGEEFIQALVKAPVGSGMVQNSSWNRGQPFYVTFRPIFHSVVRLKDEELDEYNKYNAIVEQLEYEFEQLEELKQDVFDLKLELKLAKDKIKSGNFNMVKIYLDGLTPRIQKVWDKVGKKPKKLQIKLVSEDELKAELEAAKKAKEKLKKEEAASGGGEAAPKKEEPEVKMEPDQIKENMDQINKLFKDIDEAIGNKDYFSVNDRIIEIQSVTLPKKEKEDVNKKVEEYKKKVEDAKSGKAAGEAKSEGAKPAAAASEVKS